MNDSNLKIRAAEYVLPGHPDKLCDAIADALVEQAAAREKKALCAIEVAVYRASVFVTGRIACRDAASIDVDAVVREVYRTAGYGAGWYPDPAVLEVHTCLCLESLKKGEAEFRSLSDDQSIVTGYAVDLPGTNWLPPEHWLAWRLMRRLERLRTDCAGLNLGPDGKLILLYDQETNRLAAFSASLQQQVGASEIELHRAVRQAVRDELADCAGAIPGFIPDLPDVFAVNGAGNFEVGGPEGDNGLSGKKLVVDAYGPRVPIGGGALSGKDFFKVDRAGAILARRIAKAVVLTGVARECRATLAVFPGDPAFRIVSLVGDQGRSLDASRWASLFDLTLASAGEAYSLMPKLVDVARYGHFTGQQPWENLCF